MRRPIESDERRNADQLHRHYLVEKELAERLRRAPRETRMRLYATVYDELFRQVPDHPQLTRQKSPEGTRKSIDRQMSLLRRFLAPGEVFVEVGAGDCSLSFEVARTAAKVYAIDVSAEVMAAPPPEILEKCSLILSDGCSIPVPAGTVHLAYSNQLMEHLHPDDALDQLRNLYAALAPGGAYVCITPNAFNGPHDISKYFDESPGGFHLKEYTTGELSKLFREVGFRNVQPYIRARGRFMKCPLLAIQLCEAILRVTPARLRLELASSVPCRWLLGIQLVGIK